VAARNPRTPRSKHRPRPRQKLGGRLDRGEISLPCCQGENGTKKPTARIQFIREKFLGPGQRYDNTILLAASHPCGIDSYHVEAKLLPADALIDEDATIDCDTANALEVKWSWATGGGAPGAQRSVKPLSAQLVNSVLAPRLPPPLGRILLLEGWVRSCCGTKLDLVFATVFFTQGPLTVTSDYA
jgi:hypothetical protein